MQIARWAPLVVVAAGLGACQSFGAGEPLEAAEGGVPDATASDGGVAEGAAPDGAALDAESADSSVAFECAPDAGCTAGACDERCPQVGSFVGDLFRVEGVSPGELRLRTLTDCHVYKCLVLFDKADGYDCAKPALGHVGRACSTGAPTTCPTGVVASFGISNVNNCDLEQCTYSCQRGKN